MTRDFKGVCVCVSECTEGGKGIGWGLAEIGRCIVVCARELQRAIKMDGEVSHWNAYVFVCAACESVRLN